MEEERETGFVKWNVYLYYLHSLGFVPCVLLLLLFGVSRGLNIVANLWLSHWSSNPENSSHHVGYFIGVYSALNLLGVLASLAYGAGYLVIFITLDFHYDYAN